VGKGRSARKADNLTAICKPTVYKMWEPRRLTILWAFTAYYRDSFTLFTFIIIILIIMTIVNSTIITAMIIIIITIIIIIIPVTDVFEL
jgi:hypothetical protein